MGKSHKLLKPRLLIKGVPTRRKAGRIYRCIMNTETRDLSLVETMQSEFEVSSEDRSSGRW